MPRSGRNVLEEMGIEELRSNCVLAYRLKGIQIWDITELNSIVVKGIVEELETV